MINAQGGKPRRLTNDGAPAVRPSWSRNGHWIYFGSTRSGESQIWKVPVEGGQSVQVTRTGGTRLSSLSTKASCIGASKITQGSGACPRAEARKRKL